MGRKRAPNTWWYLLCARPWAGGSHTPWTTLGLPAQVTLEELVPVEFLSLLCVM